MTDAHRRFMDLALAQAQQAGAQGEVPVGAVVVHQGQVVGQGHNAPIAHCDPTAHAEIMALRQAAQRLGNYRLDGCALYVTVEPCAMCMGAIGHARIAQLIYGCAEPRTGAVQSWPHQDGQGRLPRPQVTSGVQADQAQSLMQDFFRARRELHRSTRPMSIPDFALRTPDSAFEGLPDYPWAPHYMNHLPSLQGLRLHYLDEGPSDAPLTWVLLHGNPTWSYLWRQVIPPLLEAGHRVLAPDLIGFGKSDKPKKTDWHTFEAHRQVLLEWLDELDLQRVVLVVQDWGGIFGLTLPMVQAHRFVGLWAMNTWLATADRPLTPGFLAWRQMCRDKPGFDIGRLMQRARPDTSDAEAQAYNAPFVDMGHRAATKVFADLLPHEPDQPGVVWSRQARTFWQNEWAGRSLMTIGGADPVLGEAPMRHLHGLVRGMPEPHVLPHVGHFVPDCGHAQAQALAREALAHFKSLEGKP